MAAFMVQADARVIDPLFHVIARDFHTNPPAAAVVISSYALPYGLFQLLSGPVGDRVGKIRVMATCLAVFSFGTFACAFVPSIPVFAALRFLTGVAAAAVVPMSLSHIGDKFPYQGRQIALARFMSALMIGQIVGSTLGGIFGEYWAGATSSSSSASSRSPCRYCWRARDNASPSSPRSSGRAISFFFFSMSYTSFSFVLLGRGRRTGRRGW